MPLSGLCVRTLGPQLLVLCGGGGGGEWVGLMELLGGSALLEEVHYCEWALGVYRPHLLSVYSL